MHPFLLLWTARGMDTPMKKKVTSVQIILRKCLVFWIFLQKLPKESLGNCFGKSMKVTPWGVTCTFLKNERV